MTSPISQRNPNDPGDATQRNYQYQFAYGVVLLTAAVMEGNDYEAIWCEQEEDFLGKIKDSEKYDAIQIKTQQPEGGYWRTTSEDFVKSVTRFVELDKKYPNTIRQFQFVSNTEVLDSDAQTVAKKSIGHLLRAVKQKFSADDLEGKAKDAFEKLKEDSGAGTNALYSVLKRLQTVRGPSRDSFVAELAQNHLPQLEEFRNSTPAALKKATDALVDLVERASALSSQAPERHYVCLNGNGANDPQLKDKRISVEQFALRCRDVAAPDFRYLSDLSSDPLQVDDQDLKIFRAKLDRGGLEDHAEILRRQTLSAQAALIERADRDDRGAEVATQIENIVLAQCKEAELRSKVSDAPYGARMMIDVQDRLKTIATDEASRVHSQPYEVLLGMAGLLTQDCSVWWSEKFDVADL